MKKIIFTIITLCSLMIFSKEWTDMTRSERLQYLKDLNKAYNYKDLIYYGEKLIEDGKSKKKDINQAEGYNLTAIGYKNEKNYSKAEEYYKESADIYKNSLYNTLNAALVEKNLGRLYADQARYSDLIKIYKSAMPVIETNNSSSKYNDDLSLIYYWLGYSYNQTFSYDSAIVYSKKAIDFDTKVYGRYTAEVGGDYVVLANAYGSKYDDANATKYFREALSVLEDVDDYEDELFELGVAYNDFGIYFVEIYESDSAIYYYKKAISVFRNSGDESEEANSCQNLGYAYSGKSMYDDAKKNFEKAYNLYKNEYGEYDSRTIEAKKSYDEMKSKTSSYNYEQKNDDAESKSDYETNTYTYTPKKKSCLDNAEGCFDFLDIGGRRFSIMLAGDYMQSAGRYYVGGGLGYFAEGGGLSVYYYWSPTVQDGTAPKYIPLVYSFGFDGFSYDLSLDIPSLFDNSYSRNKSASKPYAFGLGFGFKVLRLVQLKGQYIWGPGGYLPKGLSLNAGIEFFL